MGRSLSTTIVLGIDVDDVTDLPTEIRRAFDDEESETYFSGEIERNGLKYKKFWCMEAIAGFGVELFQAYYVEDFDIASVHGKLILHTPKVKLAFKEWEITQEPKCFIIEDYS